MSKPQEPIVKAFNMTEATKQTSNLKALSRILLASLLAPLGFPLLIVLLYLLMSLIAPSAIAISESLRIGVYSALFSALINYIYFFVSYLPVYAVLHKLKLVCRKNLTRAGLGSGIVFGLLFIIWWAYSVQQAGQKTEVEAGILLILPCFAAIGYLNGWIFSLIAVQKSPDAAAPKTAE